MSFHPYLNFGGNCREAFTRYHEIFGGELTLLASSDVPAAEGSPSEHADLIMHAALTFEDRDQLLMGSDHLGDDFGPVQGMHVTFSVADVDEATRVFELLADDGKVTMPLAESFFSPRFGMCVDRFGTPWMVVAGAAGSSS